MEKNCKAISKMKKLVNSCNKPFLAPCRFHSLKSNDRYHSKRKLFSFYPLPLMSNLRHYHHFHIFLLFSNYKCV